MQPLPTGVQAQSLAERAHEIALELDQGELQEAAPMSDLRPQFQGTGNAANAHENT